MNAQSHPMPHQSLTMQRSTTFPTSVPVRARRPHSAFPVLLVLAVLAVSFRATSPHPKTSTILQKLRNPVARPRSNNVQYRPKWSKISSRAAQERTLFYPRLSSSYTVCTRRLQKNPYILYTTRFPSLMSDQDPPMSLNSVKRFPPKSAAPTPRSASPGFPPGLLRNCGADLRPHIRP